MTRVDRSVNEWTYVCIYDQVRTAHLERLCGRTGWGLVYRTCRDDFDAKMAESLPIRRMGRARTVLYLLRRRPEIVEVNEPAAVGAWPALVLYALAVRLLRLFTPWRGMVVSYAIENLDPVSRIRSKTRLPVPVARFLVHAVLRFLNGTVNRIAFGTRAAQSCYRDGIGRKFPRQETALIPALPSPCECMTGVRPEGEGIVFLGSFEYRKGLMSVLSAWEEVRRVDAQIGLTLVGKGALLPEVRSWAKNRDEVRVVEDPTRTVIHEILRAAAVLVLFSQPLPRWKEQVGLPLVEGLAHGCEVVASDETGIADWLDSHGHAVLPPGTTADELGAVLARRARDRRGVGELLEMLPSEDQREAAHKWMVRSC